MSRASGSAARDVCDVRHPADRVDPPHEAALIPVGPASPDSRGVLITVKARARREPVQQAVAPRVGALAVYHHHARPSSADRCDVVAPDIRVLGPTEHDALDALRPRAGRLGRRGWRGIATAAAVARLEACGRPASVHPPRPRPPRALPAPERRAGRAPGRDRAGRRARLPAAARGGRVRCRFDGASAFMVARVPHRTGADGLTATLVAFDVLAVAGADLRAAPLARASRPARGPARLRHGRAAPEPGARCQPGVPRRPRRRRLGGHRRQAHQRPVPLWASQSSWVKLKSPAARDRDRRRALRAAHGEWR
jgi:hypothetical protein